jgi:hypothetical protein|tara:strand:- start:945 stop:1295 length:351 start_codon:yes stop_codon:yes gene_type:complete
MATDINEIYKKYPCAKHQMLDNIKFWKENHDKNEDSCFDTWLRMHSQEDDLYNFLEDLESYDMWLLKRNEITPAQEKYNRGVGRKISNEHLEGYEEQYADMIFWDRINDMDWGDNK